MFFGHSHPVDAGGKAWLSQTFHVLVILSYPLSIIEPIIVGPREKIFQNKGSQMAGKCYLRMVFTNVVFQESHFHSLI